MPDDPALPAWPGTEDPSRPTADTALSSDPPLLPPMPDNLHSNRPQGSVIRTKSRVGWILPPDLPWGVSSHPQTHLLGAVLRPPDSYADITLGCDCV